jgi:hypothetical protein
MPHPALKRLIVLLAIAATAVAAGSASGALVEVENLVLRADGGFKPQSLPRHRFAPIDFQGHIDLSAKGGGKPSALRQALIDFDRDGRLSVAGLPTCAPEAIDEATTEEARRICKGAIVGTGHVEALVSLDSGDVAASSELTVFNGPRLGGLPTAVLHARTTVPTTQTYAIVVPIEQRRGGFRYRARIDLPPRAASSAATSRRAAATTSSRPAAASASKTARSSTGWSKNSATPNSRRDQHPSGRPSYTCPSPGR